MENEEFPREGAGGRVVRPAIDGKAQVIRTHANTRWNDAAEERFFEELAASCNVTAAAEAAGFSTTAVYNRRMRYPGFAAEWQAAIGQGYARLEAMMLERATDSLRGAAVLRDGPSTSSVPPQEERSGLDERELRGQAPTFAEALNLLRLHRAEVRGGAAQNFAARAKAPDMDEIRASILRKIEAIERAEARKAGEEKGEGK